MTGYCHVRFGERGRETRASRDAQVRSAPTLFSPVLSNVYLHQLDRFVEQKLLPTYNRGDRRQEHRPYAAIALRARQLRRRGQREEARAAFKVMRSLPSQDPNDPDYRRLHYVRYADD
jgi:hypothetical protein